LTYGFFFDWADNVHYKYGFPLTWGIHTLSTIVGPVDTWQVDIPVLFINLIFWLGLMITGVIIITHYKK
jgi:hypothetical protein